MDHLPPITLPAPYAPTQSNLPSQVNDQHLNAYIHALTSFLSTHANLYNFHAVDFFVDNTFDTHLPQEWTHVVSFENDNDDDAFLDHVIELASNIPSRFHLLESTWPKSLLEFIRSTHAIALPRDPLPLPNLPREPIDASLALGMTPKKVHEVHHLAAFISHVARSAGVTNLIDLGAGQGYLSSVLALRYGHNVLGVDTDPVQTAGANRRRATLFKRLRHKMSSPGKLVYLNKHVTADDTFAGLVKAHLERPDGDDAQLDLSRVPDKLKTNPRFLEHQRMRMRQDIDGDDNLDWTRGKWGLIGLHTCGDLAPITLRMWHTSTASLVINVGCCYNHLTEPVADTFKCDFRAPGTRDKLRVITAARSRASPEGQSVWTESLSVDAVGGAAAAGHAQTPIALPAGPRVPGFPMSRAVAATGVQLGWTARMLACQSTCRWATQGVAARDAFRRHLYRALLQVWITRCAPGGESPVVAVHTTKTRRGTLPSFADYVREAVAALAVDHKGKAWVDPLVRGTAAVADEALQAFFDEWVGERRALRKIAFMWTLRALMAGAIESLILVDRYCWMRQELGDTQGSCAMFPLFDEVDSPRNCVAVGIKKGE